MTRNIERRRPTAEPAGRLRHKGRFGGYPDSHYGGCGGQFRISWTVVGNGSSLHCHRMYRMNGKFFGISTLFQMSVDHRATEITGNCKACDQLGKQDNERIKIGGQPPATYWPPGCHHSAAPGRYCAAPHVSVPQADASA